MSDWTVHLEFAEGTSSKFWRARVEGKTLYVNYGKIGTNGQTQVKDLSDPSAAKAEYEKLIREKRKKGYVDAGSAGPGEADDGDEDGDDDSEEPDVDDVDDFDDATRPGKRPSKSTAAASSPAPAKQAPAAAPSVPGHRFMLDAGGRKVEAVLYLDGTTVRMDSRESYASSEAAKKAFERLKKLLAGEGYKEA